MKKVLPMLLVLLLCCSVALAQQAESTPYAPIHISLWANPASGYEWICEYDDTGVLEDPLVEYNPAGDGNDPRAGGSCDYYFGIAAPGRAEIIFNYGVSWGIAVPERTVICIVEVDEAGESQIYWAESYAADGMLLVKLPTNPTTGWNWNYEGDSAGIISLVEESYAPSFAGLDGAGGITSYQLHIDAPGETLLLFNHANMWDPHAAAEKSFALTLYVNEKMEISMSVDGLASEA